MIRYPVYKANLGDLDRDYVQQCLDSTWISSKGEFIQRFEGEFSRFTGASESIAVCNGTVALHLALLGLGIGPEDEVIVPTLTYIASVNAISYVGAKPIFVESTRDTWQLDPLDVEAKVSPRTKAIIAVHLYGHPCDMAALRKIADKHHLFLIEDCAEALGSRIAERHVGSIGDIATYSFYGNKTITTGEGGMLTTNDSALAERVRRLKGQGLMPGREYWHDMIGYNYRITNICAAIGCAQLQRAELTLARKREIAMRYRKELKGTTFEVHGEAAGIYHSYWMVSILAPSSIDRDKLRDYLARNGIETRPVFYPIHTMPMYSRPAQQFKVAEDISRRGINLPSYPQLQDDDLGFISDKLRSFADGRI